MTSKNGYNNAAFNEKLEKYDTRRDTLNNRLEVAGYQAINETFVDDNGQEIYYDESDSYVDIIGQQQAIHCGPGCRRSVAVLVDHGQQYRRYIPADSYTKTLCVGYHRVDTSTKLPRHRYESISSDDRYSETREPPSRTIGQLARHDYESIDALHRRYEKIEAANEEYVDYPEDRMGVFKKETYLPTRESPLGSSGTIKHIEPNSCRMNITPVSTPKKVQMTTPQKSITISPKDTPKRKLTRRNTIILAPMLANIEKQQQVVNLHRSRSTIITSPRRAKVLNSGEDLPPTTALVHPSRTSPDKSVHSYTQYSTVGGKAPLRYYTPKKLPSFNHIIESDIMEPTFERPRSFNRRPNTAIITPNMRTSIAAPLLPASPTRQPERSPPPMKSPSTFSKASWASLPTIHLPTEMLCCVGFLLLTAGAATAILCFYILAIGGRRYFLNFGAIAGFASLILGLFSCRTNKWKWLPHRNYMTGYIMLTTFSVLNGACLGGIVYALEEQSFALLDTLGGAVCGISVIVIAGSVLGMITSGCCHRPPPDNRVAHGVTGFTV